MQQNVTHVKSVKDLKNHYYAVIAIGDKESFGTLLDLDEFSDENVFVNLINRLQKNVINKTVYLI